MSSLTRSIVCMVVAGTVQISSGQEGRITVRVADEVGCAISNALVEASFHRVSNPGWGWAASARPNIVKGHTGTNGICVLTGDGNAGDVGLAVFKKGYYGSSGYRVQFTNLVGTVKTKWQPWDALVEVVLKRVGHPIPMYAKRVWETQIPVFDNPLGFDLMAGDWVAPNGKGRETDLLFLFSAKPERLYTNWYGLAPRVYRLVDYSLVVSFPNDGDGLIPVGVSSQQGGSALRLPPMAPESGYARLWPKRVYQEEGKPQHSDIREDQNYFIRVRTKKDEKGNIVSAHYGKIHGDFWFDEQGRLTFTYYLNPVPNDRNVEFDPTKNLFTDLSPLEEVREP